MYIPKIITFQFRLFYESLPGEEVYIYGENEDFGNWTKPNFKLYWHDGNIWTADYKISENIEYVKFKFVVKSDYCEKWEEGGNRLLSTRILKGLEKTKDGKYILDCIWQHFKINFNIHYILNRYSYMRIIGGNDSLHNWMSSVPLELDNKKKIIAKDGNEIEGFWTKTFLMKSNVGNNYTFDYRYSAFDEKQNSAIWEREPNRHIHILTELNDENYHLFANNPDEYKLLTNSYLEVLDVNFVADLIFNKMGDKPIFIGPYPQNLADYKMLKNAGINATLNVQSYGDLIHRQINLELHKKQAWEIGIEINHYPIEDFNSNDLANRLKGAGDKLNELLKRGKTVYVHCTAGMSRAAATVIIYLVLYEDWTVWDAKEFCKYHRPVICPNYGVINMIARRYKPGKEMQNFRDEKGDIEGVWKKMRKDDMEFKKDINKENERIRLKEIEDENKKFLEIDNAKKKEKEKNTQREKEKINKIESFYNLNQKKIQNMSIQNKNRNIYNINQNILKNQNQNLNTQNINRNIYNINQNTAGNQNQNINTQNINRNIYNNQNIVKNQNQNISIQNINSNQNIVQNSNNNIIQNENNVFNSINLEIQEPSTEIQTSYENQNSEIHNYEEKISEEENEYENLGVGNQKNLQKKKKKEKRRPSSTSRKESLISEKKRKREEEEEKKEEGSNSKMNKKRKFIKSVGIKFPNIENSNLIENENNIAINQANNEIKNNDNIAKEKIKAPQKIKSIKKIEVGKYPKELFLINNEIQDIGQEKKEYDQKEQEENIKEIETQNTYLPKSQTVKNENIQKNNNDDPDESEENNNNNKNNCFNFVDKPTKNVIRKIGQKENTKISLIILQ